MFTNVVAETLRLDRQLAVRDFKGVRRRAAGVTRAL
jgi:hypothetical protein